MKALITAVTITCCATLGTAQETTKVVDGSQLPAKKIINDTLEERQINGAARYTVFRTSKGRTLKITEKDSLLKHYSATGENVGFSFARGNPTVVTLNFPNEPGYAEFVAQTEKQTEMNVTGTSKRWLNKPMLNQTIRTIDGSEYSFDELKGKVIVLNFWFIGCAPCVKEMPELNRIVDQRKQEDVIFLAIAPDSQEQIQSFLKKREFNYQQVPSAKELSKQLEIRVWPTHMVIDKKGMVRFVEVGGEDIHNKLTKAIDECLKG